MYRTYRPQTFEDVAGQSHVTITLKNAIKENRIAHAYLFAGPRGTGKTTIAKILAKAINCTGDHPPCNECPNFIDSIITCRINFNNIRMIPLSNCFTVRTFITWSQ